MTKHWKLATFSLVLAGLTFAAVVEAGTAPGAKYACSRFCSKLSREKTWDLDLCASCCKERKDTDDCQTGCFSRKQPVPCAEYRAASPDKGD